MQCDWRGRHCIMKSGTTPALTREAGLGSNQAQSHIFPSSHSSFNVILPSPKKSYKMPKRSLTPTLFKCQRVKMSSAPQVQPSKSKRRLKRALSADVTRPYLGTQSEPLIINASTDDRKKKGKFQKLLTWLVFIWRAKPFISFFFL